MQSGDIRIKGNNIFLEGRIPVPEGTTVKRPVVTVVGFMYFDVTLGKPIWWNGSAWHDAAGIAV